VSESKYPLDVWYSGGGDDAEDVCASWGHHGKESSAQAVEDEQWWLRLVLRWRGRMTP
jgi:hypothetical protein